MKSAKNNFTKVRKCQHKNANTISLWSLSLLQKNATINYMTLCYFFHKVFAFFNIWIETMFKPMRYIGFAAKKSVFHWNCCYTWTEVLKCNMKQEGGGKRKKKSFRFAQFSCTGVSGCACAPAADSLRVGSSSLIVFFNFSIPNLIFWTLTCRSAAIPLPPWKSKWSLK